MRSFIVVVANPSNTTLEASVMLSFPYITSSCDATSFLPYSSSLFATLPLRNSCLIFEILFLTASILALVFGFRLGLLGSASISDIAFEANVSK